jgi:hypothetical protein
MNMRQIFAENEILCAEVHCKIFTYIAINNDKSINLHTRG